MLTSSSEVSFNVGKLLWGLFWMLIIIAVSYIFFPKKMLTPTEQISHLHGRILELRADIDAGKSRIAQIKGLESEFMELIRKHERLRSQSKIINADINELHDSNDQIRDQFVEYQKAYCDAICKQAIGEKWPYIKVGKIGRREFVEIIHLDRDELFYSYELPNVAGARINAKASTEQLSEKLQHRFQFELSDELKARLHLTQQCRPEDLDRVKARYAELGINAELASFFDDVPERLASAHLVISRSGASTVAEVMAIGRPAMLVPYRYATDDHQSLNAHAVDEVGAGWLIPEVDFTPESLAARMESMFGMPAILEKAAVAADKTGRPDAAMCLADLVEDVLKTENERQAA